MPSPEEFLDGYFLQHEYDPIARRAYYLKTRQLKGRRPGRGKTVVRAVRHPVQKTAAQKRKETEARVAALKIRLEKLQKALELLVAQAKSRSGVKTPKHSKATPSKSSHQTAKQKADAAKRSKDYRRTHQPKTASQEVKDLQKKIEAIQQRIKKVRAELAAANKRKAQRKSGVVRASRSVINK